MAGHGWQGRAGGLQERARAREQAIRVPSPCAGRRFPGTTGRDRARDDRGWCRTRDRGSRRAVGDFRRRPARRDSGLDSGVAATVSMDRETPTTLSSVVGVRYAPGVGPTRTVPSRPQLRPRSPCRVLRTTPASLQTLQLHAHGRAYRSGHWSWYAVLQPAMSIQRSALQAR